MTSSLINNGFIIVMMGPTASGKSALAMQIAEQMPSEIISADSMQVYRGMDIGTAKPSLSDRSKIRHHLVDILDISQRQDVFSWVKLAENAICNIQNAGRVPVIAGGSGMYIRALLYGLDPLPSDQEIVKKLYARYDDNANALKDEFKRQDPEAYKLYHNQPKKMIRALEILEITGNSILSQRDVWQKNRLRYPVIGFRLSTDREALFRRIEARTEEMLGNGWIEETKKLLEKEFLSTPTARQAIGYGNIASYLEGRVSYAEMKKNIISATKRYARRQETWFRHQHPEAEEIRMPAGISDFIEKINYKARQTV